jgi:hypothetical protein
VYYVIGRDANSQCCQRGVILARWFSVHLSGEADADLRAFADFVRGNRRCGMILSDNCSTDQLRPEVFKKAKGRENSPALCLPANSKRFASATRPW